MMVTQRILAIGTLVVCGLGLSGCNEPTADQIARARSVLPTDCQIFDIGAYGGVSDLIVVRCDHATTTSLSGVSRSNGKTTTHYTYGAVQDSTQ